MKVKIHQACVEDDSYEIARLIYQTDPYIYPAWFGEDEPGALSQITKLVEASDTIFARRFLYVAVTSGHIIGLLVALPGQADLAVNYPTPTLAARCAVRNYVHKVVEQVANAKQTTIIVPNLCVDPAYRGQGVAKRLLREVSAALAQQNYQQIELDCLYENAAALSLYQKVGFDIVDYGFGFAAAGEARPQITSMILRI